MDNVVAQAVLDACSKTGDVGLAEPWQRAVRRVVAAMCNMKRLRGVCRLTSQAQSEYHPFWIVLSKQC